MEKTIQNLIKKINATDGMSKHNFISIKGGSSIRDKAPENGNCTNTTADCKKSNNIDHCSNSYDCSESTNSGSMGCSNSACLL